MDACIDFLSATFQRGGALERYFRRFYDTVVVFRDRGLYGYRESADIPGGKLAWGGNGNTFFLSLSADGLAWADSRGLDPRDLLTFLVEGGASITRIDIAFDDRSGAFSPADLLKARQDDHLATRYRTWEIYADVDSSAMTLYGGSSSSDSMIRIYDKAAESGTAGPWVRVEWQLRRDQAQAVADLLYAGDFSDVAARLRHYCDWKVPSSDTNKARWASHPAWLALLGSVKKALSVAGNPRASIEQAARWIARQASGTLAALRSAMGSDAFGDWLLSILDDVSDTDERLRRWGILDWECGKFSLA